MFVLLFIFLVFFFRYRGILRMMKRIDQHQKSPLLSFIESIANGLTTLRSFGALSKGKACDQFNSQIQASFSYLAMSRYMSVRLDLITSISTVVTACFCVLFASAATPGLAGLALTSILQTGGIFQFAIRQLMETESMLTSVERLVQFSEQVPIEEELQVDDDTSSSVGAVGDETAGGPEGRVEAVEVEPRQQQEDVEKKSWTGNIKFHQVYARYRLGLPFVLKEMSFEIKSGETCGLVGRTGSGKSSCLLALFRIFPITRGYIAIDDVNINTIPLKLLRSSLLSIIPQDPSLFRGSVRENLDPFEEYSDAELRFALENVHLRQMCDKLDLQVEESGSNLSQGERQLFCLARALLRKTPIVCLDEATSSVDASTSKLIGETLKELFKGRTLIIVAHRLDVVQSLDLVCVLENGKCIEQGQPYDLIAKEQGPFYDLWKQSQQQQQPQAKFTNQ
jgi:ABC-type multidrug transport system fused ATPase/permease subunit